MNKISPESKDNLPFCFVSFLKGSLLLTSPFSGRKSRAGSFAGCMEGGSGHTPTLAGATALLSLLPGGQRLMTLTGVTFTTCLSQSSDHPAPAPFPMSKRVSL